MELDASQTVQQQVQVSIAQEEMLIILMFVLILSLFVETVIKNGMKDVMTITL